MNNKKAIAKSTLLSEDFEKAETDLLRAALKRSYSERFDMMTSLMKMGMMLKRAKITHKKNVNKP